MSRRSSVTIYGDVDPMSQSNERDIVFRCAGRKDRRAMHVISVSNRGVTCSCHGVDWCSHIDATLVAGERHMVPEEDRPAADRARRRMKGRIGPPPGWLATWRDDRVWRGLAPPRSGERERMAWDGRPTVCFIGPGPSGNRDEYVDHAASLGWRVLERPTAYTTLVVSSDPAATTARARDARDLNLPTIDPDQWDEWCYDMTNAVMERIETHGHDPARRSDGS